MALTYRMYRTHRIGTGGLIPDLKEPGALRSDPYRSALDDYISTDGTGQTFWDWVHDARPIRYALVLCESTKHDVLAADARIVPVSPQFTDLPAMHAWLDTEVALDVALLNRLENDGCSAAWVTGSTTRRQLIRYLMHVHVISQDARRVKVAELLSFLTQNLDTRLGDLPTTVRQRVRTWIEAKGLTTTQFNNNSTVREVLHYLRENVDWPTLHLGPLVI